METFGKWLLRQYDECTDPVEKEKLKRLVLDYADMLKAEEEENERETEF